MNLPDTALTPVLSKPTTPRSSLGVAIFGAGVVSGRHATAITASGRATLRWVCDPQSQAGKELASEFDCQWSGQADVVLDDPEVDLAYICAPNFLHHELAVRALAAGKHVFVEKPLASTPSQAKQIVAAACEHGRAVVVGHQYRYLPSYRRLKQLISDGAVGEVRCVVDRIIADYRIGTRPAWFLKQDTAGGGVLMNNGVHQIDRICWIMDERPCTVTAHVGRCFNGYDIESDVHAMFAMPSGRTAQLLLAAYPSKTENGVEVIGSTGQLSVDSKGTVRLSRGARPELEESLIDPNNGAGILFDVMAQAAFSGSQAETDASWGSFVVDTAYAIYRSAERGESVTVASH